MSEIQHADQSQGGVREAASGAVDQARETASEATDAVREKAGEVASRAGDQVRTQVDDRTTQVGRQAKQVASALRQSSQTLREQDQQGSASLTEQVAGRVERLGAYLEQVDGDTLIRDVEDFGRRRPWLLAGGGVVVGLIASRFLKASSEQRYRLSRQSAYGRSYPQTWPDPQPVTGGGSSSFATQEGRVS